MWCINLVFFNNLFHHLFLLFLQLLDSCLKSPLLPAYLAAAFAKKLSRLALFVPPSGALIIIALIHNLLRRHPSINCLVHQVIFIFYYMVECGLPLINLFYHFPSLINLVVHIFLGLGWWTLSSKMAEKLCILDIMDSIKKLVMHVLVTL